MNNATIKELNNLRKLNSLAFKGEGFLEVVKDRNNSEFTPAQKVACDFNEFIYSIKDKIIRKNIANITYFDDYKCIVYFEHSELTNGQVSFHVSDDLYELIDNDKNVNKTNKVEWNGNKERANDICYIEGVVDVINAYDEAVSIFGIKNEAFEQLKKSYNNVKAWSELEYRAYDDADCYSSLDDAEYDAEFYREIKENIEKLKKENIDNIDEAHAEAINDDIFAMDSEITSLDDIISNLDNIIYEAQSFIDNYDEDEYDE